MSDPAPQPAEGPRGARVRIWLQLAIAWIPVWALYATIIATTHGAPLHSAMLAAARAIVVSALLGLLVLRLTDRLPFPRQVTAGFAAIHIVAAIAYSVTWVLITSLIESALRGDLGIIAPAGVLPFVALGIWLYIGVAGISYAVRTTERAARAEAAAVRAQLAALRGQLNPHFLFNALHTVIQLIPEAPGRAAQAAELLAGLLRTAIQEDRDLIALDEERAFVERYIDLELLRFGDRLDVSFSIGGELAEALVPAFALQTLVENAVRHGAEPRIEPTRIAVSARVQRGDLELAVSDNGVGSDLTVRLPNAGTGLRRLQERLDALYGDRATLILIGAPGSGVTAKLILPLDRSGEWPS